MRDSLLGPYDDAVLHHPGPEPLAHKPQNHRVRDAMRHHLPEPRVVDVREVPANIRLMDVLPLPTNQGDAECPQRLMWVASGTISVGALHEVLLVDGAKNARHRALQ